MSKDWGQCQKTVFFVKALEPASVDHGFVSKVWGQYLMTVAGVTGLGPVSNDSGQCD